MTEYYDIPTTTIGADGLHIDLGQGGVGGGAGVYITIVDTSSTPYTVQVRNGNGDYAAPLSVQGNSPYQVKRVPNVRFVDIVGNGAILTGKITDYEVSPDSILVQGPVTVSGTVKTDLGQGSNIANPAVVPTGGDLTSGNATLKSITDAISTDVGTGTAANPEVKIKSPLSPSGYVQVYPEPAP